MKKFALITFILVFIAALGAGCFVSSGGKTPEELIKDRYGDTQFKISFGAEGLETPVADVYYSANDIPKLPTPEKTGYRFGGWYFDSALVQPYSDSLLLLKMTDVTLYAKWEKEEMTSSGIYDIEFSASILEDTVEKGELTDKYGGYKDFCDIIVKNQTYIEKSEDGLLLKLQYDCGLTVPFGSDPNFKVSVSPRMEARCYIKNKIASDSETIKTVFVDISKIDVAEPVYFNVTYTNWDVDLSELDRAATTTYYTVKFQITRFIGFSSAFVDPDTTLADGAYLAKVYYRQMSNTATMMDSYNPVYSYIIAENGNYKLVKPFTPYAGLIGSQVGGSASTNYYDRGMTFAPVSLCYEIEAPEKISESAIQSDYLPAYYNAGKYCDFEYEFHADTGKTYGIYDLGTSFKKAFMVQGGGTGFMEIMGAMGSMNFIMYIDYDHVTRLADCDYQPLSGDAYCKSDIKAYYAGNEGLSDLNSYGMSYDATEKYGISENLVNFYYSASRADAALSTRKMYSHKLKITPTAKANAYSVADSRYKIAEFAADTYIYGYDGKANLYADCLSVDMFGGYGLRRTIEVKTGKSVNKGENIRLESVFNEKVNSSVAFSGVTYTAYEVKNGAADYSKIVKINSSFTFEKDIAVSYSWIEGGKRKTSLVYLTEYVQPNVTLIGTEQNVYDPDRFYNYGTEVYYPIVRYTWGNGGGSFIDAWYDDGTSPNEGACPVTVAYYTVDNGSYSLSYIPKDSLTFKISQQTVVVYQLENAYGEKEFRYYAFKVTEEPVYDVLADDEKVDEGTVNYIENNKRQAITLSYSRYFAKDLGAITKSYAFDFGNGNVLELPMYEYVLLLKNGSKTVVVPVGADISEVINDIYLAVENAGYAGIITRYKNGNDKVTVTYVYQATVSGKLTTELFSAESLFTGYEYSFPSQYLCGADGTQFAYARTVSVDRYKGDSIDRSFAANRTYTVTQSGGGFTVIFNQPGDFRIRLTFYKTGEPFDSSENFSCSFDQRVTVLDGKGDVFITFVTDERHPFKKSSGESALRQRYSYSLADYIKLPDALSFDFPVGDALYGWRIKENGDQTVTHYRGGSNLTDFIIKFNAQSITLYATWDSGAEFTFDLDENLSGRPSVQKKYYMSADRNGKYIVDLGSIDVVTPAGYKFVGWESDLFDGRVKTDATVYLASAGTIKAVFAKILRVRYEIDSDKCDEYLANDEILGGYLLKDNEKVTDDKYSRVINLKGKDGYEFVGWVVVMPDGTERTIDFATDTITEDMAGADGIIRVKAVFREI